MRPVYRRGVNKRRSAKSFRRHSRRTKRANMRLNPDRGGYRM